jgi:hypothetical protein
MKGGLHPDSILSKSMDLVLDQTVLVARTHLTHVVVPDSVHIVGIEASLITTRRDDVEANAAKQLQEPTTNAQANIVAATPASVSLYTVAGYAPGDIDLGGFYQQDTVLQDRRFFTTASLTASMPTWTASPDLFGFFCDGGIFAEYNAPVNDYGIRLVVRYVPRLQFTPAYADPVAVMQHYWKCARGDDEFLDGFYGGTSFDLGTSGQTDTTAVQSSGGGSVFTSVEESPPSSLPDTWIQN